MLATKIEHTMLAGFLCFLAAVVPVFDGLAQEPQPADLTEEKPTLINRSLLSVGGDVYSILDAELCLALWNALGDQPTPRTSQFEKLTGFGGLEDKSGFEKVMAYPADVKRLMFILFVWTEARRLNLFAPAPKEISKNEVTLRENGFAETLEPKLREYWSGLNEMDRRSYLDMILRARSYLKVRGDLSANQRLTDASWYWHTITRR